MTESKITNGDAPKAKAQPLPRLDIDTLPDHYTLVEQEVASVLGLSLSTLRIWRHRRVGPSFEKHARAVRYRADDIRAFIDARRVRVESTDLRPDATIEWQKRKRLREAAEVFGETA